jgi:hypothetical protein
MSAAAAAASPSSAEPRRAVELVAIAEDGSLRACEEALALLSGIGGAISVVAIAGPQRSGKSFLLNCLAAGEENGVGSPPTAAFEVGPNVHACTKGLWLWVSSADRHGGGDGGGGARTVFLDTEGLGAVKASQATDLRTFGLSVLLSSLFIFNTSGAIDESSIKRLGFISQMSKAIHIRSEGADDSSDFENTFPQLLWVLRDFSLALTGAKGDTITPAQYLEDSLRAERGFSEDTTARNRVRLLLTTFFKRRDCACLPRPMVDEAALAAMHQQGGDGSAAAADSPPLRPAFLQALSGLQRKVRSAAAAQPKSLHGLALNGAQLAQLVRCYVSALNAGQVPTVAHAWQAVQELQAQTGLAEVRGPPSLLVFDWDFPCATAVLVTRLRSVMDPARRAPSSSAQRRSTPRPAQLGAGRCRRGRWRRGWRQRSRPQPPACGSWCWTVASSQP